MIRSGKNSDNNKGNSKGKKTFDRDENSRSTDSSKAGPGREFRAVYVRGLPPTTTVLSLEALFICYGPIIRSRPYYNTDQRCNGCAMVTFYTSESATNALGAHGLWVDQRHRIAVEYHVDSVFPVPQRNSTGTALRGPSSAGPATAVQSSVPTAPLTSMTTHNMPTDRTVFIGGLPPNTDNGSLRRLCHPVGHVMEATPLRNPGNLVAYARVVFSTAQEASAAIRSINGILYEGAYPLTAANSLASFPQARDCSPPRVPAPASNTQPVQSRQALPPPSRRRPGAPEPGPPIVESVAMLDDRKCIQISGIDYRQKSQDTVRANILFYSQGTADDEIKDIVFTDFGSAILWFGSNDAAKRQLNRMQGENFGPGRAVQMELVLIE